MQSETFCSYPWINLHTNTDGRVKLCCHVYTEDYVKIDGKEAVIGNDDFEEIWRGEYMSDVRKKMMQGLPVKDCSRCYEHESKGLQSSRQWANKEFVLTQEQLDSVYDPINLELRLGNHCNLKCSGCWSVSSDQLYHERKKILSQENVLPEIKRQWEHEIRQVESYDYDWFKTKDFRDLIDRLAPNLKRLYLTGGEPTLISTNEYVLSKLIEAGNKDCYVCWTTNMTNWPKAFYDKLDFFESSEIQMSIDGYGEENSYIRYPADWKVVNRNFQNALNLPDKVKLKLYFVYQAWNGFSVKKLINWLETFDRVVDFVPIYLESPTFIHSCIWPDEVKQKILEDLRSIGETRYKNAVDSIIKYTENTDKKTDLVTMKYVIELQDKYRKYQFSDIFPELTEVIRNHARY